MANKSEQVLIIDPQNELCFRGPFTGAPVAAYMKLTNPTSNQKVYFKIKTTAPKRYCVRPNSGIIKPKEVCEIAVCLQPYEFDPNEKSKHKFMVQSIVAPNDDPDEDPCRIWRDINPDQLMDTKLKCVFVNPTDSTTSTKPKPTTTSKPESNSTDAKSKPTSEAAKLSPKPIGETEEKLLKAAHEVNQLRVEESTLRQENLQLKEEVMKWKNAALGKDMSLASVSGLTQLQNSSNPLPMSTTSIIIAVAMVVMGYLLGKLI
ncbi:vesicle-associated membrane protein-associated protein B isoform X2 [Copidosoma floridanum]|uniref:vesicle-associated membrane protein-associated protein B isoform X2 n=1 Tax=Copidosoma floridanum TaxID=29053 RepID=UPI0006C93CBC|nr:vesicle-associated membrane protein-associated protein B isoform X2 [Copidosoma floridanum]